MKTGVRKREEKNEEKGMTKTNKNQKEIIVGSRNGMMVSKWSSIFPTVVGSSRTGRSVCLVSNYVLVPSGVTQPDSYVPSMESSSP